LAHHCWLLPSPLHQCLHLTSLSVKNQRHILPTPKFKGPHFHSGKFPAERKICKMWLADTNSPWEKKIWSWKCSTCNNDIFGTFSVRGNFFSSENGPYGVGTKMEKNFLTPTTTHIR
jgi:hypothetical protein